MLYEVDRLIGYKDTVDEMTVKCSIIMDILHSIEKSIVFLGKTDNGLSSTCKNFSWIIRAT